MKKYIVLLTIILLTGTTATAYEASGGLIEIGPNRTVDSLQAAGSTVVIEGTVDGDAQVFASDVQVPGTITGDLQAFSASTSIDGIIGGDVETFSGTVRTGAGSSIGGDLSAFGSTIDLAGAVNGSSELFGSVITLQETGHLRGNLTYAAETFRNMGQVDGVIHEEEQRPEGTGSLDLLDELAGLGVELFLGAILLLVAGRFTRESVETAGDRWAWRALLGFAFLAVTPFVLVLLMITIIGIPAALIGILLYGGVIMLGSVIGALLIGRTVIDRFGLESMYVALVTGLVLMVVLEQTPLIGGLISLAVLFTGVGGLLTVTHDRWRGRGTGTDDEDESTDTDDGADQDGTTEEDE